MTKPLLLSATLLSSAAHGAISLTAAGVSENFTVMPPASSWSSIQGGAPFDSNQANQVDTFQTNVDFDNVLSGNGSALVLPSNVSQALETTGVTTVSKTRRAAWNSGEQALQMYPTTIGASVLLATLQNDTNTNITSVSVDYAFSRNAGNGTEQLPGWRAYYSVTGNGSDWIHIADFDGGTSGTRATNLSFANAVAPGSPIYLIWLDDNARSGFTSTNPNTPATVSSEDRYTLDDFNVSITGATLVPEPSSLLLTGLGMLFLARRRRG